VVKKIGRIETQRSRVSNATSAKWAKKMAGMRVQRCTQCYWL